MRNAKKQGMAHSQEKKFTETAPVSEEAQTFYLLDKDLKSNVLNMFKVLKRTIHQELEKTRRMLKCLNK